MKFASYRLDTVRDIFLFSCYTSYAQIDSMNLTMGNLDIENDVVCWIRTKRQKSGVQSDIVALPPILTLLEDTTNSLFYFMTNHNITFF